MRKRSTNQGARSPPSSSDGGSDEESGPEPEPSEPEEELDAFREDEPPDAASRLDFANAVYDVLGQLKRGKARWAQFVTIYAAAFLTYSYANAGDNRTNVQIAIMTVITLFGATPLSSTHLIPASIGAFVGGQHVINSTGPMEESLSRGVSAINYLWLLLLSLVVGSVWFFVVTKRKVLDGYAGRLGTTTFVGMNIAMLAFFGPAGAVDWDRYYYGFVHVIHVGEEDSSSSLSSAWRWTEEAESAIAYVLGVLWLGAAAGGTRILHDNYIRRCTQENDSSSSNDDKAPPKPLNNVLIPVLYALTSMLVVNASGYKHAPALYNGFAVGSYVAMASLKRIPSITRFASASLLAALWGLMLTPFFVGFAGKSGFTSMLGHVTHDMLEMARLRLVRMRRRRRDSQLWAELHEQQQEVQSISIVENKIKEIPSSRIHQQHSHKPRKEAFYTKQQRRQQVKLKHLLQEGKASQDGDEKEVQGAVTPKLHHRAWSALPTDGDGVWQHSLESRQESSEVV